MIKTLDLVPVLPELLVAVAGLALLMLGVFRKDDSTKSVSVLVILVLGTAMLLVSSLGTDRHVAFAGQFVADRFAGFAKGLILLASAFSVAMSMPYLDKERIGRFEYPVLVLFATLGMMMMVSANDFMALYLGLELQSLTLYVLAAYRRDQVASTEAGVKYFVLGSLASGMLLYGVSLLYGFAGTTSFEGLHNVFAGGDGHHVKPGLGIIAGLVFVVAGLCFKLSAAPFHMWAPDVYEGAPTPVTSFFAVAPKIAATCLFVRVMTGPFGDLTEQWRQVITFVAVASMIVGAFGAVVQTNIKRLMAYSSIGHVGFILVGVAAGSTLGIQGVLIYLAIYLFMNVGTFAIILTMRRKGRMVEGIHDLAGLSKTNPIMALILAALMFSMAGVPPLAGFWGKFYVFMAAIEANLVTMSILGVLSSVVSAFYYLRIIKIMYFDDVAEPLDRPDGKALGLVMAVSMVVILAFTFVPAPLVTGAKAAASVLFPVAG